MAIRFTNSDKYKDPFIRSLKAPYMLLWDFINHDCNHAGIWEVDFDLAEMRTKSEVTQEGAIKAFGEQTVQLSCGQKWFIPSFIDLQYKGMKLNPENRAHGSVISLLKKLFLIDEEFNVLLKPLVNDIKPLPSPLNGAKDKDKEKDKDKGQGKGKGSAREKNISTEAIEVKDELTEIIIINQDETKAMPMYEGMTLEAAIKGLKEARIKKRTPMTDLAVKLMLNKLTKLAGDDEELKIAIVLQTIRRSWSDVFHLKDDVLNDYNQHKTSKTQNAISLAKGFVYQEVTA